MQNPDTKKHPSSGSAAQDFEARSFALLREEYEKQLNSLKKQHELSVKRLNNEVERILKLNEKLKFLIKIFSKIIKYCQDREIVLGKKCTRRRI